VKRMTIQCEYYLSCNTCHKIYSQKADDPQGVEDEAIDDGWRVSESNQDPELNFHICNDCCKTDGTLAPASDQSDEQIKPYCTR
jgi:hypothetical protein